MMTNSEAIKLLSQEKIPMKLDGKLNEPLVIAHIKAIFALEENDKLKAEIEQLKSENEQLKISDESKEQSSIDYYNLYRQALNEIEQLKSELEKSVRLPCKVGDIVYIVGKCKDFPPKLDGTMWNPDGGFGTATGYYCPYEDSDLCPFSDLEDCNLAEDMVGIFEDVVCHICIEEDKMWYVCENSNGYKTSDFGKTIFLSREEARQSLKGKAEK